VNDCFCPWKVSDGLWDLLHDLEWVCLKNLLYENMDWVLSLCDELIQHFDVFILQVLLFFIIKRCVIFLSLLVLAILNDSRNCVVALKLGSLTCSNDCFKWAFTC
jgi:hypothetical protein